MSFAYKLFQCNGGRTFIRPNSVFRACSSYINLNGSSDSSSTTSKPEIKKSVFISQSHDIFTNLALEDWIYKNFDLSNHHVLMLWANDPCVVIGRHQNPFTETNVSKLVESGITLARRNSGGGAVYHDRGNLNLTFFTPRERYNRKYNLNIITRALFREWCIKAELNERDDIVIGDRKVSVNSLLFSGLVYIYKFDSMVIATCFTMLIETGYPSSNSCYLTIC